MTSFPHLLLSRILAVTLLLFLACDNCDAFVRKPYTLAEITQLSELIVVAKVKEGSVTEALREDKVNVEHSLVLVVSEVLKGKCPEKELTILVHLGLTPVIGRYAKWGGGGFVDYRSEMPPAPKDVIEIYDTGNSAVSNRPIGGDLRQPHIWFLRHTDLVREKKYAKPGISNPEDIQMMDVKPYVLAMLTNSPK